MLCRKLGDLPAIRDHYRVIGDDKRVGPLCDCRGESVLQILGLARVPHGLALLRTGRERPAGRRAAKNEMNSRRLTPIPFQPEAHIFQYSNDSTPAHTE